MTTITNALTLEVDLDQFTYAVKDVIKREENFSAVLVMKSDIAKFEYLTPPLEYGDGVEQSIAKHIEILKL